MPEEIKLRMARAYPEQVQRVREWFQKLEELLDDEKAGSGDYGRWISGHYHEVANEWERILLGYDTLIENVCDQTKSYLEFKPEMLQAFAVANGVGELVSAAENVLRYRGVIGEYPHPIEPTERIPESALDRLSTALQKVKQGSGEDRLYKTAQTLLDLYDKRGPDQFTALFCTLDILDVCQQIVAEGEDNPHPWPGADV